MTSKAYSLEALNEFLDYLSSKHLLNKNTAQSRKAAASKILSVLDESEAEDLRKVDMDLAFQRFANKEGKAYKPESLLVYKSRLASTLTDFFSYVQNPAQFKPTVKISSSSTGKKQNRPVHKKSPQVTEANSSVIEPGTMHSGHERKEHSDGLSIPVPLREGLTVKFVGVPPDLTEGEAARLAAIIKAYAVR